MKKRTFFSYLTAVVAVLESVILISCEGETVSPSIKNVPIDTYEKSENTAIDLGLPSGLLWAAGNIGARNSWESGLYFAWGETTGYTAEQVTTRERVFDEDTYNAGSAASISADLTLEQDAAHINLGSNWRMPTIEEWTELLINTNQEWIQTAPHQDSKRGLLLTSKINGNSIFLPEAGDGYYSIVHGIEMNGYYWSNTLKSSLFAYSLYFYFGSVREGYSYRWCGFPVRAVCVKK